MRWKSMWISYFNPLPRKEGDQTIPALRQPRQKLYFNPLPRKEGDAKGTIVIPIYDDISIHSLVKRETRQRPGKHGTLLQISIHSLVKRETLLLLFFQIKPSNFNPLPRKEGDWIVRYRLWGADSISIHSLVKRETSA